MDQSNLASSIAGLDALGGFLTGIAGASAALFAAVNSQDYIGAGLYLLASAVSFGLLTIALFRR